jgi:hypothetical protein
VPTLIAFSAQGGDFIVVEEDPIEVADRLHGAAGGLVELRRMPVPVGGEPVATWVNPARVAFLMEPVQQRRPAAVPDS